MPSTIAHLNFSRSGGAGSVARILRDEQEKRGHRASFHHVIDSDLRSEPFSTARHTLAAGIDEWVIKSPSFDAPISALRDRVLPPLAPDVLNSDIVHLHGINGVLPRGWENLLTREQKVVWTLHDMNPFTGTCHYSLGCERFSSGCSQCPAVRAPFRNLVEANWSRKKDLVAALPNLRVVAPSTWLADQARASGLFGSALLFVQPNPVDPEFLGAERSPSRPERASPFTAVIVAAKLDDPVKNVGFAVAAFREVFGETPEAQLFLIGEGGQQFVSGSVHATGKLPREQLRARFGKADVIIVPSLAENAPLVIPEAASQGCEPLVAQAGGMPELVALLGSGATFAGSEDLTALLRSRADQGAKKLAVVRNELVQQTRSVFSPQAVVDGYDKVYA